MKNQSLFLFVSGIMSWCVNILLIFMLYFIFEFMNSSAKRKLLQFPSAYVISDSKLDASSE